MKKFLFIMLICLLGFFAVDSANATPINIGFSNSLGTTYVEDGFTFTRQSGTPNWHIHNKDKGFTTEYLHVHDHGEEDGSYIELTSSMGAFGIYDLEFQIHKAPLWITNDLGGLIDLEYNSSNKSKRDHTFDSSWHSVSWVRFDSGHDITIGNINLENSPIPNPEPTTMLLFGFGLIGLAGFRRKFKKS